MKRLWIALLGTAVMAGYLSLGIYGWGGWRGYFSDPARTGLAIVALGLTIAAAFSNTSGVGSGVREDRSNRWILPPLLAIGFVMPWLSAYLDRRDLWVCGGESVRWAGLVICLVGGVLRVAPLFVLGRRFSGLVAIQPNHTLKTDGLYSYIRHPSYLGLIVCTFGWMLVFRCLVPGLILVGLMTAGLTVRINSEERLLADQFGEEYAAYKKRTWRLVPWVY